MPCERLVFPVSCLITAVNLIVQPWRCRHLGPSAFSKWEYTFILLWKSIHGFLWCIRPEPLSNRYWMCAGQSQRLQPPHCVMSIIVPACSRILLQLLFKFEVQKYEANLNTMSSIHFCLDALQLHCVLRLSWMTINHRFKQTCSGSFSKSLWKIELNIRNWKGLKNTNSQDQISKQMKYKSSDPTQHVL